MKTLYLDRNDQELEATDGRLIIRCRKRQSVLTTLPLAKLNELVVFGDVTLSSRTLRRLGKAGISLVCLNATDRSSKMLCHNIEIGNVARKLKQYELTQNPLKSLGLSQYLVYKKMERHAAMLRRCSTDHQLHQKTLDYAAVQIENIKNSLCASESKSALLGMEGGAGRIYFQAISKLVSENWQFKARQKRPCKDPFNALLSLTYTLVHYEFVRQLFGRGLDPYIGFYHKPYYGRESLACDAMELLRPEIDYWVLGLAINETLNPFDFKMENGAMRLRSVANPIFFEHYNEKCISWRRRVRSYVDLFCKTIDEFEIEPEVSV